MTWVYVAAIVILVAATWLLRGRKPDSGMTTYRKHIDALSSESRREVRDNARGQNGNRRNPPRGGVPPDDLDY